MNRSYRVSRLSATRWGFFVSSNGLKSFEGILKMFYTNINEENRQAWLKKTPATLPRGARILDAGAGELRSRSLCAHLTYVSQDFCQYDGGGDGSGFAIEELTPNGDWFAYCRQELMCLGGTARQYGDWSWPLTYSLGLLGMMYFKVRGGQRADDLACFGWHTVAVKCE